MHASGWCFAPQRNMRCNEVFFSIYWLSSKIYSHYVFLGLCGTCLTWNVGLCGCVHLSFIVQILDFSGHAVVWNNNLIRRPFWWQIQSGRPLLSLSSSATGTSEDCREEATRYLLFSTGRHFSTLRLPTATCLRCSHKPSMFATLASTWR